ncbi:CDP-glycerol glycerophosphotransferase [Kineococcus radiotolerans]|uniref:UDP-N-acetylglucosamine pyrophosphorylase related protein n=2 Tax=Kineococcus radiotolerans TaxID=131568 RepID=A6W8C2_KINRD|nr:phosphocholine cytidylyltransferase family protein [Kineococcus radiotolerans]ABS03061.1 UDP-N-acetylglucosamine pyrophosphorylase related protein [Kineococcus radiotolerans SRS30216 = ATCC BAA-149]MBB2899730.1 CDP-glycerol glycerophosphotransferase [Kineococcus radiotolerans]
MNRTADGTVQAVVLAAGLGTRLGRPLPKSQTVLRDGRTIMRQQVDHLRSALSAEVRVTVVVGFKATVVMEAHPDLRFVYNERFDSTNTSKSLLRALETSHPGGVLWMNGDVVFDPRILRHVQPWLDRDETFVCVNTASVAEEEVKYTVDAEGFVRELSKTVRGGLGEAVGINHVSSRDKAVLVEELRACADDDYFERGLETAIARRGLHVAPVDVSRFDVVEVDFEEDLQRADRIEADHLRLDPLLR